MSKRCINNTFNTIIIIILLNDPCRFGFLCTSYKCTMYVYENVENVIFHRIPQHASASASASVYVCVFDTIKSSFSQFERFKSMIKAVHISARHRWSRKKKIPMPTILETNSMVNNKIDENSTKNQILSDFVCVQCSVCVCVCVQEMCEFRFASQFLFRIQRVINNHFSSSSSKW